MWRYFVASVVIGLSVSLAVLALGGAGLSGWLGAHLNHFYSAWPALEIAAPASLSFPLQCAVVAAAAFGVAWVVVDVARPWARLVVVFGTMLVIAAASPVLALYGILFEPYSGGIAALAAYVVGCAYVRGETGRRKRLFLELVAGRMSREGMAALATAPFGVKFNGESRAVTGLVCRILNGDDLRANLRAREAIALCNEFLDTAAAFLIERGAYLDRTGAGERCFYFGLPLGDAGHAAAACRAALALREQLVEVAADCAERWSQRVQWGIGIDTGEMTVGLYGVGRFAHFSALGEAPDRAARLASANRIYGSAVLVSSGTMAVIGDEMELRAMDMVFDAEADRDEEIYELLAEAGELDSAAVARRDAFWHGVVRFREGDGEAALEKFVKARPVVGCDRALEYYIARVREKLSVSSEQ